MGGAECGANLTSAYFHDKIWVLCIVVGKRSRSGRKCPLATRLDMAQPPYCESADGIGEQPAVDPPSIVPADAHGTMIGSGLLQCAGLHRVLELIYGLSGVMWVRRHLYSSAMMYCARFASHRLRASAASMSSPLYCMPGPWARNTLSHS